MNMPRIVPLVLNLMCSPEDHFPFIYVAFFNRVLQLYSRYVNIFALIPVVLNTIIQLC
jgi:hypothetical protein